ncbi:MAG: capsular biosynthesis protein [Methylococcales bacterium]
MINNGFSQFNGKRVVLLQGPIGPFFKRLSADLEAAGADVFKINFNGGDWLFYSARAVTFKDHPSAWPEFFETFIQQHQIDTVLLFGDCRPIHQEAHKIASQYNLEIGVFEEGYVRPDYITLERHGVNANSKISKNPDFYAALPDITKKHAFPIGKPFWYAAMWGMMYYAASVVARPYFRHYQHHRILSIWQGLYWIRSLWRKWLFSYQQKEVLKTLITQHHKKYYLVALQVHNDAQLHHHSDFYSIEAFISEVINSFAMHAPRDCHLVIKHHPMDRGFNHHGKLINLICQKPALKSRIHYVHDLHLPTLLNHAKGVVLINSTVGLSAILHGCPVIACGNAIYDLEGLTYQGDLSTFWQDVTTFNLDENMAQKYINHLINNSQINGNFYKRIEHVNYHSGISWND